MVMMSGRVWDWMRKRLCWLHIVSVFAFGLFMLGCKEDCRDDSGIARVHVDQDLPAEKRIAVYSAARRFNALANRTVITVDDRKSDTCTVSQSTDDLLGAEDDGDNPVGVAQGSTDHYSGNILLSRLRSCVGEPYADDVRCFESVVMHEMGHLLGMNHTTAGVMINGGAAYDYSPEDLAECRRAGICL